MSTYTDFEFWIPCFWKKSRIIPSGIRNYSSQPKLTCACLCRVNKCDKIWGWFDDFRVIFGVAAVFRLLHRVGWEVPSVGRTLRAKSEDKSKLNFQNPLPILCPNNVPINVSVISVPCVMYLDVLTLARLFEWDVPYFRSDWRPGKHDVDVQRHWNFRFLNKTFLDLFAANKSCIKIA